MKTNVAIAALLALIVAGLVYVFWPEAPAPLPPPAEIGTVLPPVEPASAASAAAMPASAASAAEMPASAASAPPPLAADDDSVRDALVALAGKTAVLTFMQTDGFAARVAATVDNLARGHAAPRLWPLNPAAEGRFTVDADNRIAPTNAARYDALVAMVTQLPPTEAAALYRRMRPQLQAAYENLGYPGRSFHARLLEVLAHLLSTPTLTGPPVVKLTEVKGPIQSQRPWVRYEYADPGLEAMSAGQKILLRVGPAHQRKLMDWMRQFRAAIGR